MISLRSMAQRDFFRICYFVYPPLFSLITFSLLLRPELSKYGADELMKIAIDIPILELLEVALKEPQSKYKQTKEEKNHIS